MGAIGYLHRTFSVKSPVSGSANFWAKRGMNLKILDHIILKVLMIISLFGAKLGGVNLANYVGGIKGRKPLGGRGSRPPKHFDRPSNSLWTAF